MVKDRDANTKKEVQSLERDLKRLKQDFEEFIYGVNIGSNETKTYIIKPNENKQDWKSLSTKIYKTKMELQSSIKDLENKIATNNDVVVVVNNL